MKYFFLLLISINNLFAQEYFLQDENCEVQAFKKGKLERVSSVDFLNVPLAATKLKLNPEYLGFTVNQQVYIAPKNCLRAHIQTSNAPRPVVILTDKRYIEIESGLVFVSDKRQIPNDYNVLFPSNSASPTSWSTAPPNKYKTKTLLQLGYGIAATSVSYYTFKLKMFSGGKVDSVTLTDVNTGTKQNKTMTYNDLFLNAYAGYKIFFIPQNSWKIFLGGYVGMSYYTSELRDELNTSYQLKSLLIPVYLLEFAPEYRLDKNFSLGLNFSYEYLGTRSINSPTATSVKTLTSYSNNTITADIKYYY
jgi:hypothetical protein